MPCSTLRRTLCLLLLSLFSLGALAQDLPRPAALEPAIRFWTRVYTEVDTDSGFLHDANNLAIVYQRVDYDRPEIERQRTRIQDALKALGSGKRDGLNYLEQQVLDLWPADVSNETLRTAANNVRFQLGQSDRFVEGLIRSGAYREHIESVIRGKHLPIELAALPHVESSFHPGAYSSVAAAGMWQFMRATGQRFMRIDHIVDERMDPYTATYAAMSLLEYNYRILGTWPLALTAYNHGTGGMSRAVRETGSDRIEDIIANYKGPSFGFASRNFYPQFLAVLDVERQAQTLFGVLQLDPSPQYVEFELDAFVEAQTLADALGVTLEHLQFDNPALRPIVWEGGKRIPKGFVVKVQKSQLHGAVETLLAAIPGSERYPIQTPDIAYVVQKGDSLSAIARRFKTSVAQLASLNQIRDAGRISIGQRLLLPQDTAATTGQSSAQIAAAARGYVAPLPSAAPGKADSYTVRRGDTLSRIANRFGMSERSLLQANNIDHPDRIYPGQTLSLNAPTTEPAQPVVYVEPESSAAPEPLVAIEPEPAPEQPQAELALLEELPPPGEQSEGLELADGISEEEAFAVALEDAGTLEEQNAEALADLAADPSDYSVAADSSIEIQASETLGHYAEWLELSSADLRRLNNMRSSAPVVLGKRLTLDFSKVSVAQFELRRRQFHQQEQQEFFRQYRIQNVDEYKVLANDNIANLARRKYAVPMWLLRQYNPDLNFRQVQIGQTVVFPVVEPVQPEGNPGV
ncbi:MAG: LysM peptidoglycan-binding domain-containing protein [Pseudomonadales bacterium]|nr:LysM peptidoglycan-binding domain-containing protein [Pseudomonadales bacterium]MCP5329897.1 LysM peptidoglycan-binding domain-containing protein [Pseudomonadales bacterium]MCP5343160.1 LysM peptidoglycan-binding domain-containing protein [Pseudomonadales bacterium]